MSCYQSDVYVPQYNEYGEEIGGDTYFTGCHANYVDTVSQALTLSGVMQPQTSNCVAAQFEETGTFRFFCVDAESGVGPFESYAFHLADGTPGPAYTGARVASIKGGSNGLGFLPDYPQQKGSDMQCVTIGEGGALVVQNPQPADLSACEMVVLSGSEAMGNPFALSTEAGATIAVAIIGVWAVAFGIRAAIQTLFVKGSEDVQVPA